MKKPVVAFTSLAALAVTALGGTIYYYKQSASPVLAVVSDPEVMKAPETKVAVVSPKAEVVVPKSEPIAPSFDTVRVESNGDAVIAGRAEPEADVTVKLNGEIVGQTTSNSDGSFVVVPAKPLSKGTGALTLEVAKSGTVITSKNSVIVSVKENAPAIVAKIDPVAPTQVTQSGATDAVTKDVQLTAVDYDAAGNIIFSGQAAPNSVVRFYVDNAAVGEGVAGADGAWSFKGTAAVTPGTHMLRADAVDADGKVVSRVELPFLREEIAVAAVAVPAPATQKIDEPELAVALPPPVVEEGPQKIVIQPGNSLWKLSREVYGKGRMFTIIYEANRDQLKNPNKIFPGQILTAPKQN